MGAADVAAGTQAMMNMAQGALVETKMPQKRQLYILFIIVYHSLSVYTFYTIIIHNSFAVSGSFGASLRPNRSNKLIAEEATDLVNCSIKLCKIRANSLCGTTEKHAFTHNRLRIGSDECVYSNIGFPSQQEFHRENRTWSLEIGSHACYESSETVLALAMFQHPGAATGCHHGR